MRIVHLDDDLRSLQLTEELLKQNPDIQYLGGFYDENLFYQFLLDHEVDLVILDVEMPNRSGLDVAKRVLRLNLPFVFLSNHGHYSLDAFRLAAMDYFIKPLQISNLNPLLEKLAIQRKKDSFVALLQKKMEGLEYIVKNNLPKTLVVNSANRVDFLQLDEIIYIEGEGSTSHFKVLGRNDTVTSSKTLKHYEFLLESNPDFVRVHKKAMVNRKYVSSILKSHEKGFEVKLSEGTTFKLASQGRSIIIQQLGGTFDV